MVKKQSSPSKKSASKKTSTTPDPQKTLATLSTLWSQTDSEGLTLVVPVESFQVGVLLTVQLAKIAEAKDHDPEVVIEHDKVTIRLISHDKNKVTDRDYDFAAMVDTMLGLSADNVSE